MRCFVLVAALLGLTACGGEMLPEEASAPVSEEQVVQVAEPAPGEVEALVCYTNPRECFCNSLKTEEKCRTAMSVCVWAYNKCSPNYE